MQQFLDSGDPILVAEAMAWAQVNPGVLQSNEHSPSLLEDSSTEQPLNRASILRAIATQIERLGWSEEQVCHELQQHFGKSPLASLSDSELLHGLEWLRNTPN
jgi:hypothetical protein